MFDESEPTLGQAKCISTSVMKPERHRINSDEMFKLSKLKPKLCQWFTVPRKRSEQSLVTRLRLHIIYERHCF